MTLAPVQRGENITRDTAGRWIPDTTGPTTWCLNMRERIPVRLEAVGRTRVAALPTAHPVASDLRNGSRYIFTQLPDGTLRLEGRIDPEGKYHSSPVVLEKLPADVADAAPAGMFLVFRLTDGRLWYLLWNPDFGSYTTLGFPPAMPDFSAKSVAGPTFTALMPAITFGKPVSDMRGGVPTDIAASVRSSAIEAWKSATSGLAAQKAWIQPVRVRLVARLWDGSVLFVSRPEIVATPRGFFTGGRILLPLEAEHDGFVATRSTSFILNGFHIDINVGSHSLGRWSTVVRSLEVWASSHIEAADFSSELRVFHTSDASSYYVGTNIPVRDEKTMCAELVELPDTLLARLPVDFSGHRLLTRTASPVVAGVDLSAVTGGEMRAGAILGHGAFLHLADVHTLRPAPILPAGATLSSNSNAGLLEIGVETDGAGGRRGRTASYRVDLAAAGVGPLLWYPSADAVAMVVRYTSPDGKQSGAKVNLTPAPSGENAAFYLHDSLGLLPLEPDYFPDLPTDSPDADHLPSAIVTMSPGNPFAEAGRTPYVGGHISSLAAQPSGGGAFTRQYIYAFSDTGITALTHDPSGRHTNFRPISPLRVGSELRIVAAASAVYALSDCGALLRIRDSLVSTIVSNLSGGRALVWSDTFSELWIVPRADTWNSTLVVQPLADFRAYMRTEMPEGFLYRTGTPLFVAATDSPGVWSISTPDATTAPDAERLLLYQEWVSASESPAVRGDAEVAFGLEGKGVEAAIELYSVAESERWPFDRETQPVLAADVAGDCLQPVRLPVVIPAAHDVAGRLSNRPSPGADLSTFVAYRVAGYFPRLKGTRITNR